MISRQLHLVMAASLVHAFLSPLAAASTPEQIFSQVSFSVVVVDIIDATGKSIGLGSGVVTGTGQVVTNCHVAQKGENLQVRQAGKNFKATLQFVDPDRDLCQLSVLDLQVSPVVLGTAKTLKVGQRVYAIGAPQGLELTLSEGLVSSLRPYEGSQYIQTSAAISPGSSGGGLFDDQGRLIGITTFYLAEGQSLNFALPVDWISELPKRVQAAPVVAKKSGLDRRNRLMALLAEKDWQGMQELTQQWVKDEPENLWAWHYLDFTYDRLKQYDKAVKAYKEALRSQPRNIHAWNNLGIAYVNLQQYDQAINAYREVLHIEPENVGAWVDLGEIYRKLKEYDQAIKAYQEALRIDPAYATAWESLGKVYTELGKYDQAIQAYRETIRVYPDDPKSWTSLAMVYRKLKQYEQAISAHREALRIQPESADNWFSLGTAYFAIKQYNQAIQACKEVLRIQPEDADAWYVLGDAYIESKQYEQAIHAYREALRIQPEDADAWYSLGEAYHNQGHRDKVREIYQVLRKLDPAKADKYFQRFILH